MLCETLKNPQACQNFWLKNMAKDEEKFCSTFLKTHFIDESGSVFGYPIRRPSLDTSYLEELVVECRLGTNLPQ